VSICGWEVGWCTVKVKEVKMKYIWGDFDSLTGQRERRDNNNIFTQKES